METLFTRVAGLDLPQKTVVACVRITLPDGKPVEEIRTFGTMTVDLLALSDWLVEQRVTHIAMESTGVLWKPVWNLLDGRTDWNLMLVNPRELKQVPGRKSDVKDSQWIAHLLACGLLRASFVPERQQGDDNRFANSEAWAPVTQLPGLHELTIGSNIAVDRPALQRVAAMPDLRKFYVGDDSNDKAKFRNFSSDDITSFRRARPDVQLEISGQSYPALSDWPGKFEGSTSIAEWTELPPGAPAPAVGTFAPDVAQQKQAEWAKHLAQPVEFELDVAAFARTRADAQEAPRILANAATANAATKSATTMKFRLIPPSEAVVNSDTSWNWAMKAPEQLALQRISTPYYLNHRA